MPAIRTRGIPKPRPTPRPTFRDDEFEFELFSGVIELLLEGVGEVVLVGLELVEDIDEVGEDEVEGVDAVEVLVTAPSVILK